jgi:hypothetical protein
VGTTNALTYWTSPNTIGALGFGTAGQFLKSQGSGNLPIWSTIYLGTDTEGNYVAGITAGTGIVVSGTPGEGWNPTIAIDTSIVPRKNIVETITAPWTFAENVWFNKNVFIAGNLSYVNVNTLNVNGSMIPIFDNQFNLGNSSNRWANVYAVNVYASNINGGTPITGSGSTGQVAFFTASNTITGNDNLYWDNTNAKLGIGTKLPQQKLDVVGNVNVTNNLYVSGNVGIGTTAPTEKLDVVGAIYSRPSPYNYGNLYVVDSAGNKKLALGVSAVVGLENSTILQSVGGGIVLRSSDNTVRVRVTETGNVGIGTTTPTSKLEVYNGDIEINDGQANGTYKIKGLRIFYAGDETQVSTTSTTPELKKQFTSVFDSSYGIKPSYVNVIAKIWNGASGKTTYLNVTLEGCNGIILSANSTSATVVKGSISVASCADYLYPTKVYLYTTSGGTAYNDLIEFYYVG